MDKTIPKPALNISSFYLNDRDWIYGHNWTDGRTGAKPFSNNSNIAFHVSLTNETFDIGYLLANGVCQPQGVRSWKTTSIFISRN